MPHIIIQYAVDKTLAPKAALIRQWAKHTLKSHFKDSELTIRIVDKEEMMQLNAAYRHKNYPTNVLSFPFTMPEEISLPQSILGDIVICAPVVNQEAETQQKSLAQHWAHMIVHGIHHLLGYDHETDEEAKVMEALEAKVMQELGFSDPYVIEADSKHHEG